MWKENHQIILVLNLGKGSVELTMSEDWLGQVDTYLIEHRSLAAVKG